MYSPELKEILHSRSPVTVDGKNGPEIDHFGDVSAELHALQNSCVVIPVADLVSIRVTGADRARFLHNFCTNNINELQPGTHCEAFFTDVRARIVAHGWIAAFDDVHEILMLSDDDQRLLNHLTRYIITEDVTVETPQRSAIAVAGPNTGHILKRSDLTSSHEFSAQACFRTDDTVALCTEWNQVPVTFLSSSDPVRLWTALTDSGITPAGSRVFHHLRIQEGFPVIGTDLTGDNLAPESGRISQAISYTKGCYLGQEPIARIDALGHVNRQMYRCRLTPAENTSPPENAPVVTSRSDLEQNPALIQLPVKLADSADKIIAAASDGSNDAVIVHCD